MKSAKMTDPGQSGRAALLQTTSLPAYQYEVRAKRGHRATQTPGPRPLGWQFVSSTLAAALNPAAGFIAHPRAEVMLA